jgi:hypothetical protein
MERDKMILVGQAARDRLGMLSMEENWQHNFREELERIGGKIVEHDHNLESWKPNPIVREMEWGMRVELKNGMIWDIKWDGDAEPYPVHFTLKPHETYLDYDGEYVEEDTSEYNGDVEESHPLFLLSHMGSMIKKLDDISHIEDWEQGDDR